MLGRIFGRCLLWVVYEAKVRDMSLRTVLSKFELIRFDAGGCVRGDHGVPIPFRVDLCAKRVCTARVA
jgi:hypothetical protein